MNNSSCLIALNKKARYDYHIEQTFEAGVVLQGWEVKSLRAKKVQLQDSHIIIKKGELWLLNSIITPLITVSTHFVPDQSRTRKLLLNKSEISKLCGSVERKGYTLIPLSLYWKNSLVKCEIALAKGKKEHDKRQIIKERDWQRSKDRLIKSLK